MPDKEKDRDIQHAYNPALTEAAFEKSGRRAWKDSPQGRAAIRLFSRGIMGAGFFTVGGMLMRRWMHSEGDEIIGTLGGKYDATKGFLEQKNPLQFIAKAIDVFVGKPIEFVVTKIAGKEAGKNAVRFRPTKFKDMEHALWEKDHSRGYYRGRSLGNETVNVTFDFFCASIGDALGRDIADMFDPGVEKKWIKDGHVDYAQAAKSAAKSAWRYVSYNGGEDWAVAIPYVYFMKGQRALINHFSPGFMYDFDRNLNGASHKIDREGNLIGNYNMEGLLDLQSRFTVYNMGTLAYRELYDYTARKMQGKNAVLYGAPDRDTSHETLGEKAANVGKWLMRSVIKGGIYMTPATPFFWITRTPQTKYRGLFIHTDANRQAMTLNYENQKALTAVKAWHTDKALGKAVGPEPHRKYENIYSNEILHGETSNSNTGLTRDTKVYFSRYTPDPKQTPNKHFEWVNEEWLDAKTSPLGRGDFKAYEKSFNVLDSGLNVIGRANYNLARSLDGPTKRVTEWTARNPDVGRAIKRVFSLRPNEGFSRFTHSYINAVTSYTPYMYAKAEAAKLWDTGKMDYALERMINGATGLNWGEFTAGVGDTMHAILHKPLSTPEREKEGQRRTLIDTSDAAAVNRTANGNGDGAPERKPELDWRERMVSGKKPDIAAHANAPKNHREREEMRKALEELHPPTNSIN